MSMSGLERTVLEMNESSKKEYLYSIDKGGHIQSRTISTLRARSLSVEQFFRDVFLPQGYPHSVSSDYLEYQLWDTLQAFASSINGTLATQAVLKGAGVGDETATVLGATLTWLWRDGSGMVGRIAFAYARGTQLDSESKAWRLVADILNDAAFFVDLIAPHFKPLFTLLACFSSVLRSIVGVAGSATRASLTQHQARANNLADVSAKDGSQETLVNLSALICSMILVPLVTDNQPLIWLLFCLLTSFHIFANYRAVRSLKMESLNSARFRMLMKAYRRNGVILNIKEVNDEEPLLTNLFGGSTIKLGSSLQCATKPGWVTKFVDGTSSFIVSAHAGVFCVALPKSATTKDILRAAFLCESVLFRSEDDVSLENYMDDCIASLDGDFQMFYANLKEAGWVTHYCLFNVDSWRYETSPSNQ